METKEIKINIPKGYEIDKENSTFECIKFKPKKDISNLTYEKVCMRLFPDGEGYYTDIDGKIINGCIAEPLEEPNNAPNRNNSVYKNRKNSGIAISKPEKSTLWSRIKKFLGL